MSRSIKITRDISKHLLTKKLIIDLKETLTMYELSGLDIDLFLLGRPWLSADDFNIDEAGLSKVFDDQIEREISSLSDSSYKNLFKDHPFDKANKIKNYEYKNIIMNNYGEPIYDQNNNLKGYKINDTEFASVYIYYNKDNLLCNKVTIKEISAMYKATKYFELISWLDIKTDTGFIREFIKNKYYYDKNNNIKLTPVWKDNSIISLVIKFNKIKITLLDSLQLIPGSLDNILKSFECNTKKGNFPYKFVNKDNLNYIGNKPSKNFYNNISELEYNNIPTDNWDLKKETLNYLKSDVEGLLEVLIKFMVLLMVKFIVPLKIFF